MSKKNDSDARRGYVTRATVVALECAGGALVGDTRGHPWAGLLYTFVGAALTLAACWVAGKVTRKIARVRALRLDALIIGILIASSNDGWIAGRAIAVATGVWEKDSRSRAVRRVLDELDGLASMGMIESVRLGPEPFDIRCRSLEPDHRPPLVIITAALLRRCERTIEPDPETSGPRIVHTLDGEHFAIASDVDGQGLLDVCYRGASISFWGQDARDLIDDTPPILSRIAETGSDPDGREFWTEDGRYFGPEQPEMWQADCWVGEGLVPEKGDPMEWGADDRYVKVRGRVVWRRGAPGTLA